MPITCEIFDVNYVFQRWKASHNKRALIKMNRYYDSNAVSDHEISSIPDLKLKNRFLKTEHKEL